MLQRLQELREHMRELQDNQLTHHALLSFWYPQMAAYYKSFRTSRNAAKYSEEEVNMLKSETEDDISLLPFDQNNATDRNLKAEIEARNGLRGKSALYSFLLLLQCLAPLYSNLHLYGSYRMILGDAKMAYLHTLTPYHQLYHNAVSELESEVASILETRARAAVAGGAMLRVPTNPSGTLGIIEEDGTDSDSVDGMQLVPPSSPSPKASSSPKPLRKAFSNIGDFGNIYADDGDFSLDSVRLQNKALRPNSTSSRSPKHSLRLLNARPVSMIGGFDNIYGDDVSEGGEDEYYQYEDAPSGLREAVLQNKLAKTNRNDEKNMSFYKHKAQLADASSPFVAMDQQYPRPGLPSQNSAGRGKSFRFTELFIFLFFLL